MLLSAQCATTDLKAMPTDENLLSVSSRASNSSLRTKIHLGKSSATSPAHHRMAINHLLHRLIYDVLLSTRCNVIPHAVRKLALGHNSRFFKSDCAVCEYDYYSKSRWNSYLPFTQKGVALFCGQVSHELMKASITLLALYIEMDWLVGLSNILGAVR